MANDAVAGIAAAELDTGADLVYLAVRLGTTAADYQVRLSPDPDVMDAGMLKLEAR